MEDTNQVEETLNTSAGESADNTETSVAPEETADVYSPDDATLERAVKAGMSLADAKALPSKDFADRILASLEKGASKAANAAGKPSEDGDFPAIDFSGFSEADGYDPNIVKSMNSLKAVIEAQAKVIKELKAGSSAKSEKKAVEVRKNLTLARPGGESGHRKETPVNAEADILSQLRSKYKLN